MYHVRRQVQFHHNFYLVAEFEDRESCVVNQQIPVRFYIMFLLTWQSLFKVGFVFVLLLLGPWSIPNAKQNLVKVERTKALISQVPKCHSLYSLDLCKITLPNKTVPMSSFNRHQ